MGSVFDRIWSAARSELGGLHLRWLAAQLLLSGVPRFCGGRLRAQVLRLAGFKIAAGCMLQGTPVFSGPGQLGGRFSAGRNCFINAECYFDLAETITLEDGVTLGPGVMVITGTHEMGSEVYRAGPLTPRPVLIKRGAWLGARCLVLPGVTIGSGAVIGAGAVVTRDIPDNVVAAGVPARVIRAL